MKKKFTRDISANTFQVVINQLAGLLIFYFCSKFLDKQTFGEINWSIALLITAFNILGSGIDQVTVRKIAAGHSPDSLMRLYLLHVLFTGLIFYLCLLLGALCFPGFFRTHTLLIALGISQFFIFLSTPFKQVATGKEQFKTLLFMSTCSNIVKAIGVPLLVMTNHLTVRLVLAIFIAGATVELILCAYLSKALLKKSAAVPFDRKNYRELIRESLPQLGSVIFNSAVARFDWILLGFISTAVVLAEYSFAYKIFELSTLPLLVLAPLLLPKFTRLFHDGSRPDLLAGDKGFMVLLRIEMILSAFIALLLNMLWEPFVDQITGGKYGRVNVTNIFILSACMPFLYMNNFLWTVNFAKGQLKRIFFIIMVTFGVNVAGDIVLIPFLQGRGAAIAYLAAIAGQTVLYIGGTKIAHIHKAWQSMLLCSGAALAAGCLANRFFTDALARVAISSILYILLLVLAGQLRSSDWKTLKTTIGI
ncbi:MAG: oligosaccharide flippase family protein [Puia sp.]|nr:oligosaccharide flippase family protein [Puia sp.]